MMHVLLQIALVNAALAMLLAVVVYAVTRLWRNAHVARVLWLLVLLKLVTPPLVDLPVLHIAALDNPAPTPTADEADTAAPVAESQINDAPIADAIPMPAFPTAVEDSWAHEITVDGVADSEPVETTASAEIVLDEPLSDVSEADDAVAATASPVEAPDRAMPANWPTLVSTAWLVGSLLCALVAVVRIARFRRVLAEARSANGRVLEICQSAAGRLGLRRFPRILLAEGNFTPLVWPVGRRSTILLPRTLASQLGDDELTTLVAHELAHLVRRDHWVRWFELLCTVLYWWHPAVWWARRELSAAEDVCCDALVLARFPDQAGCYAEALVKAIEHAANRRTMPVLASGLGEKQTLRQRITMVVQQTLPRRMSWLTRLSVCALGIAILSITLTAAPPDDEPTDLADDVAAAKGDVSETAEADANDGDNEAYIERVVQRAREASHGTYRDLHTAIGTGKFAEFVRAPGEDEFKLRTEGQLRVFYDSGNYHIRAAFERRNFEPVHRDSDADASPEEGNEISYVVFDGEQGTAVVESGRIHPNGFSTTHHKTLNRAAAMADIVWGDIMRLGSNFADIDLTIKNVGREKVKWTRLPNGRVLGTYSMVSSPRVRAEIEIEPNAGYHVVAYRVYNPGKEQPAIETVVDWKQTNGAWYVDRISDRQVYPPEKRTSKGPEVPRYEARKRVFEFDQLAVNVPVDPRMFTLASVENGLSNAPIDFDSLGAVGQSSPPNTGWTVYPSLSSLASTPPPDADHAEPSPKEESTGDESGNVAAKTANEAVKIKPGDRLQVHVLGTPEDPASKIWGDFSVEHGGTLPLGPSYGRVDVKGLTLEEAETTVKEFLGQVLLEPEVQITWSIAAPASAGPPTSAGNGSAPFESIAVLKAKLRRAEAAVQIASRKQGSVQSANERSDVRAEISDARAEYEILQERLKQTKLEIKVRKAAAEVAQADYESARTLNEKSPGAISQRELRRLRYEMQRAVAAVNLLAEEKLPDPFKESARDRKKGDAYVPYTGTGDHKIYIDTSPNGLEAYRKSVKVLDEQYKTMKALYDSGSRGSDPGYYAGAAAELARARAELAVAEDRHVYAVKKCEEAVRHAEDYLRWIKQENKSGNAKREDVDNANQILLSERNRLAVLTRADEGARGSSDKNAADAGQQPTAKPAAPNVDTDDAAVHIDSSPEGLAALREYIKSLEAQYKTIKASYENGNRGGDAASLALAAASLASARAELAQAEGRHDDAVKQCEDAVRQAEQYVGETSRNYQSGTARFDDVLAANRQLLNSRNRLAVLKRAEEGPRDSSGDGKTSERLESIGVLKAQIEGAKKAYEIAQALHKNAQGTYAGVVEAKTKLDVLQQQLKQTERIVATRRLAVAMARDEYERALEFNKASPDTVSAAEVERLRYKVEVATARVNELAEEKLPDPFAKGKKSEQRPRTMASQSKIKPGDRLQVSVRPGPNDPQSGLGGFLRVDAEGRINLGPSYGKVSLAGLTIAEAEDKLHDVLAQILAEPVVSITAAPEPLYEGRTLDEWEQLAWSEIEPDAQKRVIEAIAALGKRGDEERAIHILEQIAATADVEVDKESGAPQLKTADQAVQALLGFGPDAIWALASLLQGESLEAKWSAAANLEKLGKDAAPAVGALCFAAKDENKHVRAAVFHTLGSIGVKNDDVVAVLKNGLNDEDAKCRQIAVRALGRIGGDGAIAALVEQLDTDAPAMRVAAAAALARIGTPRTLEAALPVLRAYIRGKVTAAADETTDEQTAAGSANVDDDDVIEAISLLQEHGTDEDHQLLIEYAKSDDAERLLKRPPNSYFSPGRDEAAKLINQLRKQAGVPEIEVPTPRWAPSQPSPAKPPEPELVYDGKTFSEWERLARTEVSSDAQKKVITALVTLGRAGEEKRVAQLLVELGTDQRSREVGDELVKALVSIHGLDVPVLVKLLEKGPPSVQRAAVSHVKRFGAAAEPALPALSQMVRSENVYVRLVAIRAIGDIGVRSDEAVQALTEVVENDKEFRITSSPDSTMRIEAAATVLPIARDEEVAKILPMCREAVSFWLQYAKNLNGADAKKVTISDAGFAMLNYQMPILLLSLVEHGNDDDRTTVRSTLSNPLSDQILNKGRATPKHGQHYQALWRAVEKLKEIRDDPDDASASKPTSDAATAEFSYQGMSLDDWIKWARNEHLTTEENETLDKVVQFVHQGDLDGAADLLMGLATDGDTHVHAVAIVFSLIAIDRFDFERALRLVKDGTPNVQIIAASKLGRFGDDAVAALPVVLQQAKRNGGARRYEALGAIREIGAATNDVIELIDESLDDADKRIRHQAAVTLVVIGSPEQVAAQLPIYRQEVAKLVEAGTSERDLGYELEILGGSRSKDVPLFLAALVDHGNEQDRSDVRDLMSNALSARLLQLSSREDDTSRYGKALRVASEKLARLRDDNEPDSPSNDDAPDVSATPDKSGLLRDPTGRVVGIWGIGPIPFRAGRDTVPGTFR